eukprot:scaffold1236_cov170-Ochromonas_danica.AAC.10
MSARYHHHEEHERVVVEEEEEEALTIASALQDGVGGVCCCQRLLLLPREVEVIERHGEAGKAAIGKHVGQQGHHRCLATALQVAMLLVPWRMQGGRGRPT